jgi:hypothetical protein
LASSKSSIVPSSEYGFDSTSATTGLLFFCSVHFLEPLGAPSSSTAFRHVFPFTSAGYVSSGDTVREFFAWTSASRGCSWDTAGTACTAAPVSSTTVNVVTVSLSLPFVVSVFSGISSERTS